MRACSDGAAAREPRATAGFSLIELLVASAVTVVLGGGVLALALSSRRAYEVDQVRVGVNRSLRAAGDFLVADIHQAGERLPDDFPAIEIVDGAAGAPDELVLRRNLLQVVLRVCSDTSGPVETIEIAWKPTHPLAPPPAGCTVLPDDDADGWPDNIQRWKERREAGGGAITAYIYNPVTRLGEPFSYDLELNEPTSYVLQREVGTPDWTNNYPMAAQSRLYILEERRYRLVDGVLELVIDRDTADPSRLVDRISDFQLQAELGGVVQNSLVTSDAWYDWVGLAGVSVRLDGSSPFRLRQINRNWTTRVLPRNVLSR